MLSIPTNWRSMLRGRTRLAQSDMGSKQFFCNIGSGPSGPLQVLRPKPTHAIALRADGFDGQRHGESRKVG